MIDFRKVYRVGTRGSKLALTQTKWVISQLTHLYPEIDFDIVVIKTKGDQVTDRPLSEVGGTGVFVKEIESALLEGEIDIAIHSMKDMPSEIAEGLAFSPPPLREDPRDVLIYRKTEDLPLRENAVIGTGSIRRQVQLLKAEPTLQFEPIRGNVDSRLDKLLQETKLDGIVLAMAGIRRLGLLESMAFNEKFNVRPFEISEMLPAPCQGILGIQHRANDVELAQLLGSISDAKTYRQFLAERAFQKAASGSCHIPIGAYYDENKEEISLEGLLGTTISAPYVRKIARVKAFLQDLQKVQNDNTEKLYNTEKVNNIDSIDIIKQLAALGEDLGALLAQEVNQLG